MGLVGSSAKGVWVNPLLAKTRSVSVGSWASEGILMIVTVPNALCFGEPRLSGGVLLFGPAPRPRALATYNFLPSGLTRTLLGHHPTGMCPTTIPLPLLSNFTTPTALIPASA